MAIDTAAKRLSALDFGEGMAPGLPMPDGSVDEGDRYHLAWLYSGFAPELGASNTGSFFLLFNSW